MTPRRPGVEAACLAFGLAVLAGTVWIVGLDSLATDLRRIGWGFLAILPVEGVSVVLNTAGWALAFPSGERTVSGRRLLAARLAGDAVNYLTPTASVGGELLRVRLLGRQVPASLRWGSVSVAKAGQSVAQAVFILLGLAVVVPRLSVLGSWPGWVWGAVTVTAAAAAVLIGAVFVRTVGRGFFATARGALGRVRLAGFLPASWSAAGRELDATLGRLGAWRVAASLGCFVLGWVVGAAEIYLILSWVGDPVSWRTAVALETGSVLLDGMLFFVPAKVGTQEGGKVALFAVLGLSPARGLTVGVARRIRELVYAGLGLIALAALTVRTPADTAHAAEEPLGAGDAHRA